MALSQTGVASFPNLFSAQAYGDSDPSYSTTILFDKTVSQDGLIADMEAALTKKFGKVPAKWESPIKDGDEKTDKDGKQRPEYAGKWYITVKSKEKDKPVVVDENRDPILDQNEVYGGCLIRASFNPFAYDYMGKKGVSLYLKGIQKMGAGEPFSVGGNAIDDFAAPF
jgi:hypothetical protein